MRIKQKLFYSILTSILVLGGLCSFLINRELSALKEHFVHRIMENKMNEILQNTSMLSHQALEQASLFTRIPAVIHAFELAHMGNISNEADPNCHHARKMLRREMKYMADGFSDISGQKIKLHFHLPNGRSLVRLWRDKQIKRNGEWLDISDDISDFRNTVIDVNTTGRPVQGIELGRGGFVIRGVAPVKNSEMQLGSVEVLFDFTPILKSASSDKEQKIFLFMNADRLHITHKLQDDKKYPLINSEYILAAGGGKDTVLADIDFSLLHQGKKELSVKYKGNLALAAFPINDYKKKQIGVINIVLDIHHEQILTKAIKWIFNGMLAGILMAAYMLNSGMISISVLKPLQQITCFSQKFSQGDLTQTLDIKQKDEIGSLAGTLNHMTFNIRQMLREIISGIEALNTSASDITKSIEDQAEVISGQSASVAEISATMSEFLSSSSQVAENSDAVAGIAIEELQITKEGAEAVDMLMKKMNDIDTANKHMIKRIIHFGKKTSEIGKVMKLINNIANQTRLIAFNASLESAASGGSGKRFGVVASEIRRLADSVMESTGEIEFRINEIQDEVHNIIIDSEESSKLIQKGLEFSKDMSAKLERIVSGARNNVNAAKQISISTRQQKNANEQVVTAIQEINEGARQTNISIHQIHIVCKDLTALSEHLQGLVEQFTLANE